jgi:putative FmdB family regulatory protein
MPSYNYRCDGCDFVFEATHAIDANQPSCPECSGPVTQVFLVAPAIHGSMARGREMAVRSMEPKSTGRCCGRNLACCR